jgi:hypothetical protein
MAGTWDGNDYRACVTKANEQAKEHTFYVIQADEPNGRYHACDDETLETFYAGTRDSDVLYCTADADLHQPQAEPNTVVVVTRTQAVNLLCSALGALAREYPTIGQLRRETGARAIESVLDATAENVPFAGEWGRS